MNSRIDTIFLNILVQSVNFFVCKNQIKHIRCEIYYRSANKSISRKFKSINRLAYFDSGILRYHKEMA